MSNPTALMAVGGLLFTGVVLLISTVLIEKYGEPR